MSEFFNDLFEDIPNKYSESSIVSSKSSNGSESKKFLEVEILPGYYFCSKCGKKIKSDSTYCRYCGHKIDDDAEHVSNFSDNVLPNQSLSPHKIPNTGRLEEKISNEPKMKKATVANEIIANLKMIGCALLTWLVYLGAFYVYHQNDIKELKMDSNNSYYGESCYDGIMTGVGQMNPEKIYNRLKYYETNHRGYYYGDLGAGVEHINICSTETVPDQYKNDPLYNQAVQEANRNKINFLDDINSIRQDGFKEDLKKHAIWSAIFCLLLFVIGRYIIISIKWIDNNRSK